MVQHSKFYSMTGFGGSLQEQSGGSVSVEIRSVNHRFLDVRTRLSEEFYSLEPKIRTWVKGRVSRGRFDISVQFTKSTLAASLPVLNKEIIEHYQSIFASFPSTSPIQTQLSLSDWIQLPGVLEQSSDSFPQEELEQMANQAFEVAFEKLLQMRESEGLQLKNNLEFHLRQVNEHIQQIENFVKDSSQDRFDRMKKRIEQLQSQYSLDPQRLYQEYAILAERCDVTEEIERIQSHFKQFMTYLEDGGVVGRRLDFLCQELLREANTIGSKIQNAMAIRELISVKAEIEKLREQVQNVE